jgi:hypothetical protein
MRASAAVLVILCVGIVNAWAAEHPSLARARALYNAADYDGAIDAATTARADARSADAAALVLGRSHLERFRLRDDAADLVAAREALAAVRAPTLAPRDQLDLLVGLGQSLYVGETYGAAAEIFGTALSRGSMLPERDRWLLLEWWAIALDKDAQRRPADHRATIFERVTARMEEELQADPANAPANYWLVASTRGSGDLDRAWHAAIAGWVRAGLRPDRAASVRADLDRLITQVLIPERVRAHPTREQQDTGAALRAEWEAVKAQWK